jgi:hypothetical protein
MLSLIVQIIGSCLVIAHFNPVILVFLAICTIPSAIINIRTKKDQMKMLEERSFAYRKMSYNFNVLTEKSFVKEFRLFGLYDFSLTKEK